MSLDGRSEKIIADLVGQVAALRRGLARVNRSADLRHAAIDGGKGITVKDDAGATVYALGTDPVTGVTAPRYAPGPTPAQPSTPVVTGGTAVLVVAMDGLDVDEAPAPDDLARVRVHATQDSDADLSAATVHGDTTDPRGSVTVHVPAGTWHVRVDWVTLSGQTSEPSEAVTVDVEPLVDTGDIDAVLAAAEARVDEVRASLEAARGTEPPTAPDTEGRVYWQVDSQGQPVAAYRHTDGAWTPIPLDEAVYLRVTTDQLVAGMALIGGTLIEPGAVTADHITATEELTAKVAQFLKVKAGMIEANAFEGQTFTGGTFTGTTFQTNAVPQRGVKMDSQGFRAYTPTGTQTFNVDPASGQVTANGMDVRGGAVTGANVVGGYVGTANTGRRVFLQGDALTAKNASEQTTAFFTPDGIGLIRPGSQEVSAIGPHIFGTDVITASTDTNTDIPVPSGTGTWSEWRIATPSATFQVVSRRYALDYGFTIRPDVILANANARLQFRADIADENGVLQGLLLGRAFHMQDVTTRAPHNFYLSTMVNIPSSMPNGTTARLSYGFRIRGINGGFFSDVNMKMTPS